MFKSLPPPKKSPYQMFKRNCIHICVDFLKNIKPFHSLHYPHRRKSRAPPLLPGLHLQRNRRKSTIQKIYDGRGNFNDGCVASGARLLRRLRCSTLTTGPS